MNSKLLKISILFDKASDEPVCIRLIDNGTGLSEEFRTTLENTKSRVHAVLEGWQREGHAALTPEVREYYAAYVDYETRRRAAATGVD